jgi:tRNA(fMet)-specific endonuclease VapC
MLDTNVLIRAERRRGQFDLQRRCNYEDVLISAITVSELLIGVYRADTENRRVRRSAFVEAILAKVSVPDFTSEVARVYAGLYAALANTGQLIGAHDLITAATAISHDCTLLTANIAEFKRVPGLEVLTLEET